MPAARFLVAPDKFKGTLTATEVADAVAAGLRDGGADATVLPVADGGDGTAAVLLDATGGRWVGAAAVDAAGSPVRGRYALLGDGTTAVIELAAVAGLATADRDRLDPLAATSRGAGMLAVAAIEAGASRLLVAPGGSASTDGGAGMLAVLDEAGVRPQVTVACDVEHHFLEAATVFAPQKGAGQDQVRELEARLDRLARTLPRDPRGVPRTGCGGGLSGGLWAALDARLESGAGLVLDRIGFDSALAGADVVVTGEGRLDGQTGHGKAVAVVAQRCRKAGVPAVAVVGRNDLDRDGRDRLGLARVIEAGDPPGLREAGRQLALQGPGAAG